VKIWRRLQSLGAVAIKNSVYVIPENEETLEDFQWVLREIVEGGGEASICSASFIEGLNDDQIKAMFRSARDLDYSQISEEAKLILNSTPGTLATITEEETKYIEANLSKLKKNLSSVYKLDFFKASGRQPAENLLEQIEFWLNAALAKNVTQNNGQQKPSLAGLRACTWVTRKGLHVDRIACAWLIHRFIDPDSQFKFVSSKGYRPKKEEIRFDMFEGEFTHEGERCTFETLVELYFSSDHALVQIGHIIHDLDFKESKFGKLETIGIGSIIDGLTLTHRSDEARLKRGSAILDDLYEYFRRKPS
jgi:hypothetical protein